jgi:hypothetical protein
MRRPLHDNSSGQTLIALLIFIMLAIMITVTAATITIVNLEANNGYNTAQTALSDAESGAENAVLQLERNPDYNGETMTLSSGSATITVSGTTTKIITSVGKAGNFNRTITVTASDTANAITVISWIETT